MIAVKQYYKSLEYVQSQKETLEPVLLAVLLDNMTKKQYLEICRIAIVNNGNALKYVKSDNMSDKQYLEICKLAVQKDGNALYFVPKLYKTFEMYKLAVQNTGIVLCHIINSRRYNEITPEEYLEINKLAVENNGCALEYVPDDKKTLDICKIAVENNGSALQYVPNLNMTYEIVRLAVQKM